MNRARPEESDVDEELDVEGWLELLCEAEGTSGTKFTRPSSIFVIVLSTFLVIPANERANEFKKLYITEI